MYVRLFFLSDKESLFLKKKALDPSIEPGPFWAEKCKEKIPSCVIIKDEILCLIFLCVSALF